MSARPADPRPTGAWFTSSYSNAGNGCVQVRFDDDAVLLADSKQRGAGPVIPVSPPGWAAFVATALGRSAPALDAPRVTVRSDDGRTVLGSNGAELVFTAHEWSAFVRGAADGEFTPLPPVGASPS